MVFHNLRGYNGHFIMQGLARITPEIVRSMTVVPDNAESYKAFLVNSLRFIDSWQLMPGSLDAHMSNLPDGQKHLLRSRYPRRVPHRTGKRSFPIRVVQ